MTLSMLAARLVAACLCVPATALAQSSVGGIQVEGGIAYVLNSSPSRVLRYDLGSQAWLAPVPLPAAPSSFIVGSAGLFAAFGARIDRIAPDGSATTLATHERMRGMALDGDLLFAKGIHRLLVFSTQSGQQLGGRFTGGSPQVLSPSRNLAISGPKDYCRYTDAGAITSCSFPGETPETFLPGDGDVLVTVLGDAFTVDAGSAELTSDAGQFGTQLRDVARLPDGRLLVLTASQLRLYDAGVPPVLLAQRATSNNTIRVRWHDGFAHLFELSTSVPEGVRVIRVPLSELTVPALPSPIDPAFTNFHPSAMAIGDGMVFLADRNSRHVHRWNLAGQRWDASIRVPESVQDIAYNSARNLLFIAGIRTLYAVEAPGSHTQARTELHRNDNFWPLQPMGTDLLLGRSSSEMVMGPSRLRYPDADAVPDVDFYDARRRRAYSDSRDWDDYLGNGQWGEHCCINGNQGLSIAAVSPDGTRAVSTDGAAIDPRTFEAIAGVPVQGFVDAEWHDDGRLYRVRGGDSAGLIDTLDTQFVRHARKPVAGRPRAVFTEADRRVVVSMSENRPFVTILDSTLAIVAPPVLASPVPTGVQRVSDKLVLVAWRLSPGAAGYRIERSPAAGADWQVLAAVPHYQQRFGDDSAPPATARYRVVAINGDRVSAPSVEWTINDVRLVPPSPTAWTWAPEHVAMTGDQRVLIAPGSLSALYTWDVRRQRFLAPLAMNYPAQMLSPSIDRMRFVLSQGRELDLGRNGVDLPMPTMVDADCGSVDLGNVRLVCGGGWLYVVGRDGRLIDVEYLAGIAYPFLHDPSRGRLIAASGRQLVTLALDHESIPRDPQWHSFPDDPQIDLSLRAFSPGYERILVRSGQILDGGTLAPVARLAAPVRDAYWTDAGIIALSADGRRIDEYRPPDYAAVLRLPLAIAASHVLPTNDGGVVVVSSPPGEPTRLERFDAAFRWVEPPLFGDGFD